MGESGAAGGSEDDAGPDDADVDAATAGLSPGESPPAVPPQVAVVVLGRFQPLHSGHAHLIGAAVQVAADADLPLRIAVGSTNRPESIDDPWSFDERRGMIEAWAAAADIEAEVVGVPDIDDPPRWVEHASRYHGGAGVIVTSDGSTAELYGAAGWRVERVEMATRDDLQGWRIRATMRMLSTITDEAAVRSVLQTTVPAVVIDWLLEANALRRLAFLGCGGEPVG